MIHYLETACVWDVAGQSTCISGFVLIFLCMFSLIMVYEMYKHVIAQLQVDNLR